MTRFKVVKIIKRKWHNLMTCGSCGCIIDVLSEFSCDKCGRMLCRKCYYQYHTCKDHRGD